LIAIQLDKKFLAFNETEGLSQCSHKIATGSYPEPVESSPYLHTLLI